MTTQRSLFDAPAAGPQGGPAPRPSIDARFDALLEAHPHLPKLVALRALRIVREERATRVSMKRIFEELRADRTFRTGGEPWKLDNSLTAPMARLVMEREPSLRGVFEVRGAAKPAAGGKGPQP